MTMVPSRSSKLGPAARPVAVPIDFDVSSDVKAEGVVELPIHVWWSEPRRTFDLASERDRRRLYELVLTEGDESDVRFYVSFDDLRDSWPQLFLPRHVRSAWESKYPELSASH